ncbi:MAG: GC-type dockerin domain-anchored protein [Phycisphaerales bacterium JB064]
MKARAIATNSFVGLALLAGTVASAQDQELNVQQHANVQMMIESILHGVHMQTEGSGWEACTGGSLNIDGVFDAEQWAASGQGGACGGVFRIDYAGDLAETPDGYSSLAQGHGFILGEEWHSDISALWGADADGNLMTLDYEEVADDGGSFKPKWWVYAAEILVGGAIGSVGGVGVGTVAGAAGAVNISNAIDKKDTATSERPTRPGVGVTVELSPPIEDDQIVVVVAGTGEIAGNRSNHINFQGRWSVDPATGQGRVSGRLTFEATSGCYADLDGDGALTVFDFLAFQNAFARGDATADCDGDGALSLFDFLCFQNAFAGGC